MSLPTHSFTVCRSSGSLSFPKTDVVLRYCLTAVSERSIISRLFIFLLKSLTRSRTCTSDLDRCYLGDRINGAYRGIGSPNTNRSCNKSPTFRIWKQMTGCCVTVASLLATAHWLSTERLLAVIYLKSATLLGLQSTDVNYCRFILVTNTSCFMFKEKFAPKSKDIVFSPYNLFTVPLSSNIT